MPESVCIDLCEKYQAEKESVQRTIGEIEKRLAESNKDGEDAEEYIRRLKCYGKGDSLTREMCLQLIDYIAVGEKVAEGEEREIDIHYKFRQGESLAEYQLKRRRAIP